MVKVKAIMNGGQRNTERTIPPGRRAVVDNFKNVVFLEREYSVKAKRDVYVVRLVVGDLHRVRYWNNARGFYDTEQEARSMFNSVVDFAEDGELVDMLIEGPEVDGHLVHSAFDL